LSLETDTSDDTTEMSVSFPSSIGKGFPRLYFFQPCSKFCRTPKAIGPSKRQCVSCQGSPCPTSIEAPLKFGWWKIENRHGELSPSH